MSVVGALFTLNAYLPIRRPGPVATVSFFAGWLTCELAAHHLAWQMLATLVFVWMGALDSPQGLVAMGLSVLSWASLARLVQRGHHAWEVTEAALEEGLAPNATAGEPRSAGRVPVRAIARPFHMHHPDVVVERDVPFHDVGLTTLCVDVYAPRQRPAGGPLLLFFHGGAWILGFKQYQALPMMHRLAAAGWICMSFDYRLSPRATFPDHLIDVKHAIAWAKEHAADYGGDASFVAVSGNSAGAHLASLAALTWDDATLQPGFEEADTRVDACVALYGVYDIAGRFDHWRNGTLAWVLENLVMKTSRAESPDRYRRGSPIDHARADAPPFLVVHGARDTVVPTGEARQFVRALREAGAKPVVYLEVPDAQHAFDVFRSVRGHHTLRAVSDFLVTVRARAAASAAERAGSVERATERHASPAAGSRAKAAGEPAQHTSGHAS